jgi:hypothetical protein
MRKMYKRTKKK